MISRSSYWVIFAIAVLNWTVLVADIALKYPDNHGAGPMGHAYVFGGVLLMSMVFWIWTRKAPVKLLVLAAVGLAMTWVMDVRNISVDYDEWTRRGMPAWGEATHSVRW
jgi:hypothetical protein